jgi:hypothetical protein
LSNAISNTSRSMQVASFCATSSGALAKACIECSSHPSDRPPAEARRPGAG